MEDFPELRRVLALAKSQDELFQPVKLAEVAGRGHDLFQIFGFQIGKKDPNLPVLGLFGGVHGLERVGAQVNLSFLESLLEQLSWDADLREKLQHVRILSIPLVNPSGMYYGFRSNLNGVDLMRNAPIEADGRPAWLLGGHRISSRLPWYRGPLGAPMEIESQAVVDFVKTGMFGAPFLMAMDFHSGFGRVDRLWYPYAKSTLPYPNINESLKLKSLLDRGQPNHVYHVEPQSLSYTTHGDLWDYLYEEHALDNKRLNKKSTFLPWTLEMGSWNWVRKNPLQALSALGPFNPVLPHRKKRMMRRHLPLVDFFMRATRNYAAWL